MTDLALAFYLLFLALAFGWRTWLQVRRTGDHGFRGFSRGDPLEMFAGILFTASLLALLGAPLAARFGWLEALTLPSVLTVLGWALALAGFAGVLVAQLDMGASWRVGVDPEETTSLVQDGLFAVVRNPIFSAIGLFALGFALVVPNALSLVGLVCGGIGLELQVRRIEEPYLLRTHGEAYAAYARRVGRFVPGFGRLGSAQ